MGGFVNCEWNDKKLLCSQDMPINGDGDFFIFGSHEYQLQPEWHHHIDYKMLCTLVNCTTFIYYSTVSKKWATHTSVSFSSTFSHTHTHIEVFFPPWSIRQQQLSECMNVQGLSASTGCVSVSRAPPADCSDQTSCRGISPSTSASC